MALGQASVAYYPFRDVLSVSSNPNRPVWIDARLQTNTLFGSLSTTVVPMLTIRQRPASLWYVGLGLRFNALNGINNQDIVEGYSAHIGVRVNPIPMLLPNVRIAFELTPYSAKDFKSGILYSYFGVAYQFPKSVKKKKVIIIRRR